MKQDKAKKNRASVKGGTLHSCGSIPASEHKRRMKKELGKEPSTYDLFMRTHKRKDTGEFIDQRSADAYAEYNRIKAIRSSQTSADEIDFNSPEEETAIWLEAVGGKNKKGHVFGVGSEVPESRSSSVEMSNTTETWIHLHFQTELERRLAKQSEEAQVANASLKKTVEEQQQIIEAYKNKFAEHERLFEELFQQIQISRPSTGPSGSNSRV